MLQGKMLSAKPLDAAEQSAVERRFSALLGQEVRLETQVDPSLLGGVRVEVGGRAFDGSLQRQLQDVLNALRTSREEESHVRV